MTGAFGALQSQVTTLNAQLAQMVALQNGVDPSGYERMTKAAALNSKVYRNAAASSGMFNVEQLKVNKATEEYTRLLQKQKITFGDMIRQRKIASAAYREQLAMQNMVVRRGAGGMLDVTIPREVNSELNTMGNRIGWIREQTRSAATQMVNWGKNTQWAGRQLMVGFTMPVAAFGAATGILAYQIDKQLTRIQKVYDTTADANNTTMEGQIALEKELAAVRESGYQTALTAAKQYGAAAADTLDVQAELAATGQKGMALQKATSEVMRIAVLGEMEHADAIRSTIALQSVFRMNTEELTESFNYMNAVENATSLQLKDFAAAIPIAAGPIKQMGGDIYELGVLLTAMRERGVEATQGANAIKAAMQRLYRPSKQIRKEFQALTGESIVDIVNNAKNLTEIMQEIGRTTEGMSRQDATKVYAGLFGSYQVTRMSAMVEGVRDLEKGIGQVSAASELASGDTQDWADAADREMKRMQESVSGRFKIAVETVKAQLADFGAPFISAATKVINIVSSIIEGFQKLPGGMQKFIAGGVVLTALAGPLVMLTGLFANLLGTTIKMGVGITGLLTRFKLLDKESRAAALASEMAEQGFISETTAVKQLTAEINRLTQAQVSANQASRAMHVDSLAARAGISRGAAARQLADERRAGNTTPSGLILPVGFANEADEVAKQSEKTKRNWGGIAANVGIAATSLAVMAGTGDGMLNDFANMVLYASLLTPLLSGAGSAIKAMRAGDLGKTITDKWAAGTAVVNTNMKKAGSATKTVGRNLRAAPVKTFSSGISKAAGGLASMVHPAALIAAAVAAAGFGIYKWHKYLEEQREEMIAEQKAIHSSSKDWANVLGLVERKYSKISTDSATVLENTKKTAVEAADAFLKTEKGGALIGEFKNAGTRERNAIAMQQYVSVIRDLGGSAEDARRAVEILFLAAGEGSVKAISRARDLQMALGDSIDAKELSRAWTNQLMLASRQTDDAVATAGKNIGVRLADAIASSANQSEKNGMLAGFNQSVINGFDRVAARIPKVLSDRMKQAGAETRPEIQNMMADWEKVMRHEMSNVEFMDLWNLEDADIAVPLMGMLRANKQLTGQAHQLRSAEAAVVKELAHQLGIVEKISTIEELRKTWEWQMETLTKSRAKTMWENYLVAQNTSAEMSRQEKLQFESSKWLSDSSEKARLQYLNTLRTNAGLKETGNLADGMGRATMDINGNMIKQGNITDSNNNKLREQSRIAKMIASISAGDINTMFKDAYSSLQQGMADNIMGNFTRDMDSALDAIDANAERRTDALERSQEAASRAMQNRHDAASRAMERRQENASDRLERRQESRRDKVENSFDHRIERINDVIEEEQKADEIRQRLFDAEMQRLSRLAEVSNRNIDFNVALNTGDLDEAARIRNDMDAQASEWALSDAAEAGGRKSASRVDKLEGRIENIEKHKDARLKALDEIEEREKRALDRSQDREKRALARSQERQQRALERSQELKSEALQDEIEMEREAAQKRWETRKENLQKALDDFTGYIARNEKDLKKHIKIWENEHKGLSKYTKGQFNITADEINDYIVTSVEHARREMVNTKEWSTGGKRIAKDMIEGAFGVSINRFKKWLVTGNPKFLEGGGDKKKSQDGTVFGDSNSNRGKGQMFRHEGGPIGTGGSGSRKGYARTAALHRNEVPIVAEKGEFMVSKRAYAKNSSVIDAINAGKNYDPGFQQGVGGAGAGFAGLMASVLYGAIQTTMGHGIQNAGFAAMAAASAAGPLGIAGAGMYGDRTFTAEQMKNAATIANIGNSMGMSARDIQIGIMTAITESGLRNVHYGDRDSQGLFQQRPSQGWGTIAQVTNPNYASRKFFSSLRQVGDRRDLSPWVAAQAVQRSAFADGSNYRQYWDEAQAIFNAMGRAPARMGSGGWHLPIRGRRVGNTHAPGPGTDIGVGIGTPVQAVYDGTVIRSTDIRGSNPYDNDGYASYGRYVMMRHDLRGGPHYSLYAHLSRRGVGAGQFVRGGTTIGQSGSTGNSSGPHLHFEVGPGLRANSAAYPGTFLARQGLPALKDGAFTLSDGMAMLHRGETVLTADLTNQLIEGIGRFANGGQSIYNLNVNANGTRATANDIARAAVRLIEQAEARKPQSRRG